MSWCFIIVIAVGIVSNKNCNKSPVYSNDGGSDPMFFYWQNIFYLHFYHAPPLYIKPVQSTYSRCVSVLWSPHTDYTYNI